MKMTLIVAIAKNGVIGKDGDIPWKLRNDLQDFAQKTKGNTVIMGRNTYESILRNLGKPLPNRHNIVLSSTLPHNTHNITVVRTWEEALRESAKSIHTFVIGGEAVYREGLRYASHLSITRVHREYEGDTYFPTFDSDEWKLVQKKTYPQNERNECPFTIEEYERVYHTAFVDLDHARTEEQRSLMEQITKDGVCPFCEDHITRYHPHPLHHSHWCTVTKNMSPYEGTEAHWLIIIRRHVERFSELTKEEWDDVGRAIAKLEKELALPGISILMRSGDTRYTGASVAHCHLHVIAGETDRTQGLPLRARIGYRLKSP